jgi:hypothetical protein
MKKLITITVLLLAAFTQAKPDLNHIVKVLRQIESHNEPSAIGDNGKAFGVLQIHKIYVQEVNNRFGTTYTHKEMFQENCAEEVFFLYMEFAIERFERKYKRPVAEQDVVRMHNGGAFQGHRIESTKKYYNKYLKMSKKMKLNERYVNVSNSKDVVIPLHESGSVLKIGIVSGCKFAFLNGDGTFDYPKDAFLEGFKLE